MPPLSLLERLYELSSFREGLHLLVLEAVLFDGLLAEGVGAFFYEVDVLRQLLRHLRMQRPEPLLLRLAHRGLLGRVLLVGSGVAGGVVVGRHGGVAGSSREAGSDLGFDYVELALETVGTDLVPQL